MFNPYPNLPHQIRNYVLKSVLGNGGFGIVYKATNTLYNLDFAVKVVCDPKDKASKITRSFDAEVNALLKLDHPNVIRLYDFFREDNYMFLVLEYCPGGTLEDKIKNKELLLTQNKITICSQILSALKYCYDMSIAHRDIKTSNVLFDANGRVKVADFGLSELIGHDEHFNEFNGSRYYIAPEIYKMISFSPFKADVWSLGVLFYRLFSYSYPFTGKNNADLKKKIILGFYPQVFTPPLSDVVRYMLAIEPDERLTIEELSNFAYFKPVRRTNTSSISEFNMTRNKLGRGLPNLQLSASTNNRLKRDPGLILHQGLQPGKGGAKCFNLRSSAFSSSRTTADKPKK